MSIYINQLSGHAWSSVDGADRDRAVNAAKAACAAANVRPEDAYAAYCEQWDALDSYDGMTGAAVVWIAAQQAADIALTSTWLNPRAEVFCIIAA
jgi:hypothetical protein